MLEEEEDCMISKEVCCKKCKFRKRYDYGKKIYYCDHENRIDDMGKLGVGEIPEGSPEWCPMRNK